MHLSFPQIKPAYVFLTLIALTGTLFSIPSAAHGQEVADTIKVNTRVVFLDALVKDKRTGVPISDLKPENFEILDDGNSRPVSYFSREGQARKPLALVLILDLRDSGAGRFLKRPEILKSMSDELGKLSPKDEVAILAIDIGEDEKRLWLTDFTRDQARLVAALARTPEFIGEDEKTEEAIARAEREQKAKTSNATTLTSAASNSYQKTSDMPPPPPAGQPTNQEPVIEITKGKDGSTVTRTTRADGSIDVKRVGKGGDVTIELSEIYDMAAAVQHTIRKAEAEKPNSQLSIVWVSDGIVPVFFEDRDATEQLVIRSNVIFNSLTVELKTLFKLLMPIGKPVLGWMGVSIYGSAKRLAQQSGGEAVRVNRVKDYGAGLSKIIGNLTARYSLGFQLADNEQDDGRLHKLEVKVKAQDAKGKTRKLEVSARQGYYMSETRPKESASREW